MKRLLLLGSIVVATLSIACAPGGAAPDGQAPPDEGKPKAGGVLSVNQDIDPFDWDLSYVGKSSGNREGQGVAYNSLLGYKTGPDIKYSEQS